MHVTYSVHVMTTSGTPNFGYTHLSLAGHILYLNTFFIRVQIILVAHLFVSPYYCHLIIGTSLSESHISEYCTADLWT